MADKLRLSAESTEILSMLSSRLNLKRHTICRIALSISLVTTNGRPPVDLDYSGQEFNKSTIMGADEFVFLAMISNNLGESIEVSNSFNTIVRDHIIAGLKIMNDQYLKINSPTEYYKKVIGL